MEKVSKRMDLKKNIKMNIFVSELLDWNKGYNLIGRSTEEEVWENHIIDSIVLIPFIEKSGIKNVIDLGSGAGLPGIPLSIMMPNKHFILTDVVSKKLDFLNYAYHLLVLNAEVVNISKGYTFKEENIIISRAYGSVKKILEWRSLHTTKNKLIYLMKGKVEKVRKELEEAGIEENYKITSLDKGCILELAF
jgi:16S rRNA (guanine527-N7)-methyltransferase